MHCSPSAHSPSEEQPGGSRGSRSDEPPQASRSASSAPLSSARSSRTPERDDAPTPTCGARGRGPRRDDRGEKSSFIPARREGHGEPGQMGISAFGTFSTAGDARRGLRVPPGRFLAWLAPRRASSRSLDRRGPQAARPASAALRETRNEGPGSWQRPPRRPPSRAGARFSVSRRSETPQPGLPPPRARGRRATTHAATLASSPGSTSSSCVERAEGGSGAPEQMSASVSSSSAARSSWESSSAERTRSRPWPMLLPAYM
jgi:hypothetical protein